MLQQILRDMWVDPEILAELDEGQKQTLFCKMREEQVRRWRVWDEKQEQNPSPKKSSNKPKKTVNFLLDVEGEPWTWVMGEHSDDKKIEEILEEEARELARQQAEREAEELRKTVEKQLLTDLLPKKIEDLVEKTVQPPLIEDSTMEIYCSVDELRERIQNSKKTLIKNNNNQFQYQNNFQMNRNLVQFNNFSNLIDNKRDVLNEISLNRPTVKVAQKVALWEKRLMEERTSEIFERIQRKHLEAAKEAEQFEKIQEQLWKEQERKAKEAEQQIREIARRAREEHRRTTTTSDVTLDSQQITSTNDVTINSCNEIEAYSNMSLPGSRPPSKQAVIEWYRASEVSRRAGIDEQNQPSPWFHGLIDRQEAESLLSDQQDGTFLLRLSERIWGYAISYRSADRCKHYLVDASNGHYQFLGANQISHNTLSDLIQYHETNPITSLGNERLLYPCPKHSETTILNGVFR